MLTLRKRIQSSYFQVHAHLPAFHVFFLGASRCSFWNSYSLVGDNNEHFRCQLRQSPFYFWCSHLTLGFEVLIKLIMHGVKLGVPREVVSKWGNHEDEVFFPQLTSL
jgi:hypothetical protein